MKHISPATLAELLRAGIERHPQSLALIFKDGCWSYAEFQSEVHRIANAFLRMGVKKGDKIAFVLCRIRDN
jgi:fatty-acyl-CoA synthase